jgi:pimeloyl-ACP methyl ester carboxylesterase
MSDLWRESLRLHYEVHGAGSPVLLLHGGVSSFEHNYVQFGWVESLTGAGLQVVGLDFRGHGRSERPHEAARYGTANLAGDVVALLDHLRLARVSIVAYSIGTVVALALMRDAPQRFERAVLLATGDGLVGHPPHTFARLLPDLVEVFGREQYPRDLPKHQSAYWKILEQVGGDRAAMRALASAAYPPLSADDAAAIRVPTLIVSGELDPVLGRGPRLAAALGRGEYLEIAGANHFALAMDPAVREATARFLRQS